MVLYEGYVYCEESPSGKKYIGITTRTPDQRFIEKISHCKRQNDHYRNAIKKYNRKDWNRYTLAFCEAYSKDDLIKELNILEQHYILYYKTHDSRYGYNKNFGGVLHKSTKEIIEKAKETKRKKQELINKGLLPRTFGHFKGVCISSDDPEWIKYKREHTLWLASRKNIKLKAERIKNGTYESVVDRNKRFAKEQREGIKERWSGVFKGMRMKSDSELYKLFTKLKKHENDQIVMCRRKQRITNWIPV